MNHRFLTSLGLAALLSLPLAARADLIAQDTDTPVNTTTAGSQVGVTARSDAGTRDGVVIVWQSDDGDGTGVVTRRVNDGGFGPETFANTTTAGNQGAAAVSTAAGKGFVVTWAGDGADGDGSGVVARRYDSTGSPLGTEFLVNEFSTADQNAPSVAMASDGSFVVVWQSFLQDGDQLGVVGRRFAYDGSPVGTEFVVNSFTTGSQTLPAAAVLDDGGFVVAWESEGEDGAGDAAVGRIFDDTGAPASGDLALNGYTTGNQTEPHVSGRPDGSFVAVWSGPAGADTDGVTARVFAADGSPLSDDVAANEYTTGAQGRAAVASDQDGSFVVTWDSAGQDGDSYGVFARRFDAGAVPDGGDLQVNGYTTGFQGYTNSIAPYGPGRFVVIWADAGRDGDSFGLFGRALCVDADGDGDCAPSCGAVPASGCRSGAAGKSKLLIKDSVDDGHDQLKWKFGKGDATSLANFFDPVAGTPDYVLCVYDGSTAAQPLLETPLPGGGMCSGAACWKAAGTKGFIYRDNGGQHGGISKAKLKSGDAGKSQVQVLAKGMSVQPPAPPLTGPVTVQLIAADHGDTVCWQSVFTEAKNKAGGKTSLYKAKGP